MLELLGVTKVYRGGKRAVDEVTMRLGTGLVGLLGPNGAGKSSLMRITATITRPTSGRLLFEGADVVAAPNRLRRVLGYLPQDFGVYPHLTGREFLAYLAAVKGLSASSARRRIDELLALVNLTEAAKRPLRTYSGGMLRRVGIAQALLNDPRVLIVDEPTAGLDPEERIRFRDLLSDLAGDRLVLLSTHIVSDIESVATEIAILARGRLYCHTTPEGLLESTRGWVWQAEVNVNDIAELRTRFRVSRAMRTASGVRVRLLSPTPPFPGAVPVPPDLEDAYLKVIHAPHPHAAATEGVRR